MSQSDADQADSIQRKDLSTMGHHEQPASEINDQPVLAPKRKKRRKNLTLRKGPGDGPEPCNPLALSPASSFRPLTHLGLAGPRKRDSNGNIKQAIAGLRTSSSLPVLKRNSNTPEQARLCRDLPKSVIRWEDRMEWPTRRQYHVPRTSSPQQQTGNTSPDNASKGSKGQEKEKNRSTKHQRNVVLLEWRNKERFEEPLRI